MLPYDRIESRSAELGIKKAFLNNAIGGYRGKLTELGKGKTTLTDSELSKIATALMTTCDYLLGKTDDPTLTEQIKSPPLLQGELSDETKELIRLYDLASPELRSAALAVLKSAEAADKALDEAAKVK